MGLGEILTGAGSGALTGGIMGAGTGPGAVPFAIAGGLLGGLGGLFTGNAREDAAAAQQRALDAAMSRLQTGAKQQYADRMAAMDKVMGFYQPAQNVLNRLYGTQTWAPGPAPGGPPTSNGGASRAPRPAMPDQGGPMPMAPRLPPKGPPGFPAIGANAPGMSRLGF